MAYRYQIHSLNIAGVADAIVMVERHNVPAKTIIGPQDIIAKLQRSPSISAWGLTFIVDPSLEYAIVTDQ